MAPAYEFYDNLNDMVDIQRAWQSNDWNAFSRDLFAMTLGAMTAVLAAPAGPAWSVAADVAMSEAYKRAHDAANKWSSQQDWSALFDFIDQLADTWRTATELGFNDVYPGSDIGVPGNRRVNPTTNTTYQSAVIFTQPGDPLTLDLDGDGLETVGIEPSSPIRRRHEGHRPRHAPRGRTQSAGRNPPADRRPQPAHGRARTLQWQPLRDGGGERGRERHRAEPHPADRGGQGVCVHAARCRDSGPAGAELWRAEGVAVWGVGAADGLEIKTDGIDA